MKPVSKETEMKSAPTSSGPWWQFGHVWLVIAGPLLVIVAAVVTAWIAISHPDPVLSEDYYRQGLEINKTLNADPRSLVPAQQARNHAATPADTPLRRAP
jgi:hypothetical protein